MSRGAYYIVNGITFYRLLMAPVLIFLIFKDAHDLFRWLLPVSFFTDLIDGFLARRYRVNSVLGARLDSVADDFTVIAAIIGLMVLKPDFVRKEMFSLMTLLVLFLFQMAYAFYRYHTTTSFHAYSAKVAAILQGLFFIFTFLFPQPLLGLFYPAVVLTALNLIEEIILIYMLPEWKANVRGIYWVLNEQKKDGAQENQ